ncbi:SH3 domain-containing protein [Flagellimonas myxillae]|uniref:SH3 domain-containing protein n=1 Tax=Flagellimonas myxillae TaxID=2942214 RepID=UPI00201EB704|nr:SH3 domain-containing protein [Muricauda myxillae]MCL6267830.1 SH3 domain-containing protein [Muricauda myxillae]
MKTKFWITALTTLFTFSFNYAQDSYYCPTEACSFQPGQKVYVFGNDTKLRSTPSAESEVLELLKIGEWIEILEKTQFSWPYKGFDSPFYKVKYDDGVTGYVLGGLISLERKTLNGENYYFAYSKKGKKTFLNIRSVKHGDYVEIKVPLSNTDFKIEVFDNKGIPGIDGILYINYFAEACGVDGGGTYLFAHNGELTPVGSLSQVTDSGVYFHSERFIFPTDVGGLPDKILFKKEQGELYDESTNWTKTTVEIRELSWMDGQLVPNFNEPVPN